MSRFAQAWIEWQLAESDAQKEAQKQKLPSRRQPSAGPSVAFTIRLDRAELDALRRRCAVEPDLKPSVLARRFIRRGLMAQQEGDLIDVVEKALADLDEVRRRLGDAVE